MSGAPSLPAYEGLGVFYLGREVDPASGETAAAPLLYDAADLVTHALAVGMTGSGKTGLLVALLEEAALDGVPALVIDPKGDLANLLLTFPDLAAADFAPWVDADGARREGVTVEELAAQEAAAWREGLARWDQDGERIRRLRAAADFAVYTPGSTAGRRVSVLSSFAAPPAAALEDAELVRDRVTATVGSLLGLLGVAADPVKSREHILLSLLLEGAWREGRDLDLGGLIAGVQAPPVERVGVLPLETFFPAVERFALAMTLNNLLASPAFASWLEGEPLEVPRLLYGPGGRPRVAVFSLAHLSDAERMFFVSLLVGQVLGWVRGLSGSSGLRALLAIDEVVGYLPPVAEPPSKRALLTLLKQARAFGLGVVLGTQNPVDLDYRALSNIGTWFLGRLQTQQDKDRLLDGLDTAGGAGLPRAEVDRLLSSLDKRVFLLRNVHDPEPVLLRTRWVMSYLAGPLTRDQLRRLDGAPGAAMAPAAGPPAAVAAPVPEAGPAPADGGAGSDRPLLPPDVPQAFLPAEAGAAVRYRPWLLGLSRVHFADARRGIAHTEEVSLLVPFAFSDEPDWDAARRWDGGERSLADAPAQAARFAAVPGPAAQERSYGPWQRQLAEQLYRSQRLDLPACPTYDLVARPGEAEGDFRLRLAGAVREARDAGLAELRERWAKRLEAEREKARRAEQAVERESRQAEDQKRQAWLHAGSTLLGALVGRRKLSATSLHRAGTSLRGFSRSGKEAADVERAEETAELRRAEVAELEAEAEREAAELAARHDPARAEVETLSLAPRKSDVEVRRLVLAWVPE